MTISGPATGTGPWTRDLPYHPWTESQTCAVLEDIASSRALIHFLIVHPKQKHRDKKDIEINLCFKHLTGTEWMKWMLRHKWVQKDSRGLLEAASDWHENHFAITRLLKALHPVAESIKSKLGPASDASQLRRGSEGYVRWARLSSTLSYPSERVGELTKYSVI
ncbi:uncharacterized protein I303_106646 [Kwoniella dejecticola CBS 10117]|uniref:Uncharacterized protein n=1 Tax=Kwoniella dejecticola CBS 10117 TaxID=1296121 RepID=A0A1A5ZU35_9TREE|nr:uncharacterized protein I303_08711 [Kwoniella dejecticola CBS 10117]OBR81324.1 hypothetical protein I303_08711 [Kwoniella dejecticola CBS 10117]